MKYERKILKIQFERMAGFNALLTQICNKVDSFVSDRFKKECKITCVFKNEEFPYSKWKGVDIDSEVFSLKEIKEIVAYVNDFVDYDVRRPHLKAAVYQDLGEGSFLHIRTGADTRAMIDEDMHEMSIERIEDEKDAVSLENEIDVQNTQPVTPQVTPQLELETVKEEDIQSLELFQPEEVKEIKESPEPEQGLEKKKSKRKYKKKKVVQDSNPE